MAKSIGRKVNNKEIGDYKSNRKKLLFYNNCLPIDIEKAAYKGDYNVAVVVNTNSKKTLAYVHEVALTKKESSNSLLDSKPNDNTRSYRRGYDTSLIDKIQQFWDNFNYLRKKDVKNILEKEREASKNYSFANLDFKFDENSNKEKNLYSAVNAKAFPETSETHRAKGSYLENVSQNNNNVNNINNDDVKFSIKKDNNGDNIVVVDKNIIKGVKNKDLKKFVKNELKKNVGSYYTIT